MKKRLVVKIGTSTLTSKTNRLSFAVIEDIARQIIQIKDHYDVILVSSGAIATARQYIDLSGHTQYPDSKQALAAIGQHKLMNLYDKIFESFGLHIAQCLLTYIDFENDKGRANTIHTINRLLAHGYIPIINENDTVANEEILLGDNDKLSAHVASVLQADLLILVSDIDGLFTGNPNIDPNAKFIEKVDDIAKVKQYAQDKISELGTGGMITKLHAAQICKKHNIEMWIVNGSKPQYLVASIHGNMKFTKFV